jgi:hypothetical protein
MRDAFPKWEAYDLFKEAGVCPRSLVEPGTVELYNDILRIHNDRFPPYGIGFAEHSVLFCQAYRYVTGLIAEKREQRWQRRRKNLESKSPGKTS